MTDSQSSIQIELDPQNPAQFFACCGIFELAAMFGNEVTSVFDYDPRQPRKACFHVANSRRTLGKLLQAIKSAEVTAPEESGEAPVTLAFGSHDQLTLDWWLEESRSKKSRLKLWAGQQTTLNLVRTMVSVLPDAADANLFHSNSEPMSGRFGLDPRSAWNTLDLGFSANEQGRDAYTFPATEMLAAIGLQGLRPKSGENRNTFSYRLWSERLPLVAVRAVVAGALPISNHAFSFTVEKRSGAYSCFTFAHSVQGE